MKNTERAWVEIDLDAISHNIYKIKQTLSPETALISIVKADAYGHGAVEIAKTALENGADLLAVAFIDEAIQLRQNGIDAPILLLGSTSEHDIDKLLENNLTPTVFTLSFVKALSKRAEALGLPSKIHIKADTGMHRIGFLYDGHEENNKNTIDQISEIAKLPYIELEGLFTHLATSDEEDTSYTHLQLERFAELKEKLQAKGISFTLYHAANSAGLLRFPKTWLNAARAGIIMYGLYPSELLKHSGLELKPAMSFKTRIININKLPAGCDISYGRHYTTTKNTKIATLSAGYADGYSRLLSNKVSVLVNDTLVPQVGKICMDQCMIDVTNVNNINIGDEVTLFGAGNTKSLPIEDIANALGTINYEIACMISKRIPRIYIKNGNPIKSTNYLLP